MRRPHFLAAVVKNTGGAQSLVNERTGGTLASSLEAAFDSRERRTGLLGRTALEPGAALLLAPCAAVHTWFMRFSIDLVFVARDGVVTKVVERLRPWRVAMSPRAFAVVEVEAGTVRRTCTRPGDRLLVR